MTRVSKPKGKRERSPSPLECTAYHEAGHAVVAHVMGFPVNGATIVSDEDTEGKCRAPTNPHGYVWSTPRECREITRAAIIVFFAGDQAEKLFHPGQDPTGGGDDNYQTFRLMDQFGVAPREAHRKEARKILRQNWALVERVASALLGRKTLNLDEMTELLGKLEG